IGDELDLFALAGFGKPVQKSIRVAVDDGRLDIEFAPHVNHPLLSGIEVRRVMRERR
ncbi:MAG: hypothetical protein GY953_16865, partial [bacterium]|nr:hypothetical protein [bacterium]